MEVKASSHLSPYPSIRDSGLPWLGQIPAHWVIKRLKFVASVNPSKTEINHLPKNLEVSFMPMELVGEGTLITDNTKTLGDVGQGFTYFRDGDVVIAKITPSFENGKGAIAINLKNGIGFGTTELHVLRPTSTVDKQFLYYLTISRNFRHIGAGMMQGTAGQKRVPDSFLINYPITYPSVPEQQTIAAFLDRQTAKIDSLIARKQRLLDLLAEQRSAIISHAVTKGLAPTVKRKDSGVPWLGEVPSHWEVDLVKRHFDIELGKMLDSSKQPENGFLKPYLRAANIYWEGAWLDDVNEMKFTKPQLNRYRLQKGDLLVTEGGVTVGRSTIWQGELEEVYYQNSINRARPKGTLPVSFLYYWLYGLKLTDFIDNVVSKATFGHLTKDKLELLQMTVPPKQEAELIVAHLAAKLLHIARVEDKINDVIGRLREYRSALITSVVTGKIDVRNEKDRNRGSYTEKRGNLFNSKATFLGNTVNCDGVMGKGIALEFRRRYPDMFRKYQKDCLDGKLVPGHIYYYSCGQTTILNITTKNHWRYPSKIEWIRSALEQFAQEYKVKNITSVSLPLLGTQSGGLDGREVTSLMLRYLQDLPGIEIEVYTHDPSEGDPLFQILKGICLAKDPLRYFTEAGFPSKSMQQIVEDVISEKIHSLAQLNQSKLLSEKRLDKLYIILMQLQRDEKANKVTQTTLF